MVDAVGTTAYSYTDFGALLSEDGPWADDTVSYSYINPTAQRGTRDAVTVERLLSHGVNQLTSVVRTNASATVAGTTTSSATNVTVAANGGAATAAIRFADATFARTNVTLVNGTNTFVAVAGDSLGRWDTNTVTPYLPTGVTFLYDLNGNMRTNGTRIFEYDDENQLTRITEPGAWKSEFTYDGKMKMRLSRDYTWQSGTWVQTNEVRRVYDGMLVIQERDSFNVPKLTYTRGKDLSGSFEGAGGIGGLLALTDHSTLNSLNSGSLSTSTFFFHSDGNGNVTCLVDTNQNVVARYLDDPFGNPLSATGPKAAGNLYRFSSKEQHPNSGLVYYGYRWYSPERQRWLNRDPIGEDGGLNLYTFVANSPTIHIDALGEMSFSGCDGKEEEIRADLEKKCDKLNDDFAKCLGHCNIPSRLKWMCDNKDNLTIKCESNSSGSCKNACGWSLPFGLSQTLHLCPSQWSDPRCGDPGCTMLHEMTHMIGHPGEKWPDNVEKCLGCNQ